MQNWSKFLVVFLCIEEGRYIFGSQLWACLVIWPFNDFMYVCMSVCMYVCVYLFIYLFFTPLSEDHWFTGFGWENRDFIPGEQIFVLNLQYANIPLPLRFCIIVFFLL